MTKQMNPSDQVESLDSKLLAQMKVVSAPVAKPFTPMKMQPGMAEIAARLHIDIAQ